MARYCTKCNRKLHLVKPVNEAQRPNVMAIFNYEVFNIFNTCLMVISRKFASSFFSENNVTL